MDNDLAIRSLVAGVQALLTGEAEVVDGVLRLPETVLDSNEDRAVSVDIESEPGHIVYRLVPYPPE